MDMPSIKQLTYLIQIVECDGFSHAAEKLYIAQSALSRQIKLLEEEIGFDVFDRQQKKVKLTKAGQFFYKQIKNTLLNLDHIIEDSQHISTGGNHVVKLSHSSSIVMNLEKVQIFKRLTEQFNIGLELNTGSSEQQIYALKEGEIDIGFIRQPVLADLNDLHVVELYREPLFIAINENHALANEKYISMQQLRDESFVSTPHAERGGLSYLASNLCLVGGFKPKKSKIQSRKISQLQLVAANLGICIVPEEMVELLSNNVKLIPIKHENAVSAVSLVWRLDADEMIQKSALGLIELFSQKVE